MKLLLQQPFSIEIPQENNSEDEIITGTLSPLSKKEMAEFKKEFEKNQKLANDQRAKQRQLIRLTESEPDNLAKKYKLEDEIEKLGKDLVALDTEETTAKSRFEKSVRSKNKSRLEDIADLLIEIRQQETQRLIGHEDEKINRFELMDLDRDI